MRGYGQLTKAQLLLFWRNKQVLFWSLLFPIFLMVMLGSFLSGGQGISLSAIVIDEDGSGYSQQLKQQLTEGQAVVVFEEGSDKEAALDQLRNGDQQLVVVIPEGYGDRVAGFQEVDGTDPAGTADTALEGSDRDARESAQVNLFYDKTNVTTSQVGNTLVSQIVDQFSKEMVHYEPAVTLHSEGVQSVQLSFMDFLVPGIVAMMIMTNNLNGVSGQIASWRERGVLRRMQSTTLRSSTFIAAQITARLLLNGAQAVIVLLVGNLFFGTQVNGSWPLLLMFVILGTLAFMSIGFIIAGLAKTPESAGPIAGFVSFPLLFLGGVFFPINNMPDFLQPLVKSLPIAQLSTALRQIMNVGADLSTLWLEAVLLGGWLVVAFIIASFTFRWE